MTRLALGVALVAACGAPAPVAPTVPSPREQPPARALDLPRTLAAGLHCPRRVAVDASHVYWMDSDGVVARAEKAGGAAETIAAAPARKRLDTVEADLVVDDDAIVWSEVTWDPSADRDAVEAVVRRRPKGGGAPTVVAKTDPTNLFRVALDDGWIYWEEQTRQGGRVARAPKGGGRVEPVGESGGWRWAVSRGFLYGVDEKGIARRPISGGAATRVADGDFIVSQMLVDDTRVYWSTVRAPHVLASAPASGGPTQKLADVDSFFEALDGDATHLYWLESIPFGQIEWTSTRLQRAAKRGGPVETLGDDFAGSCMDLAVDADAVYVACCGTGGKDPHDGSVVARAKSPR